MSLNTKAQTGNQAQLSIGEATSGSLSTTWTPVEEVNAIPLKQPEANMVKATHLQSTLEQMIPGILAALKSGFKCNRVPGAAGQAAVLAANAAKVPYDFKVQLAPDALAGQTSTGDMWTFSAYVINIDNGTAEVDKLVEFNFDLQYCSVPAFTAGS